MLISFSLVLLSTAIVCMVVLFADLFKLRPGRLATVFRSVVIAPGFLLLSRAFFGSFSELYHLSYLRLIGATFSGIVGGFAASYVVTPLMMLPLLYLLLRFHDFWEAVF